MAAGARRRLRAGRLRCQTRPRMRPGRATRRVRRRRGDGTRFYRGPCLVREVEAIQVGEDLRLLLAEDSERLQELLSESLKSAGYRLDIVASVAELASSAASVNYDL